MEQQLFETLMLKEGLARAIIDMGFTEMTDIQAQAIPVIRSGKDVIGRSQTGTGKTVAFGIPAIEAIDPEIKEVQVLILSPTRELAQQAAEEMKKLSVHLRYVHIIDVYGGASMERQFAGLKRANLVIGTPGRIMDHMRRGTLKLDALKLLILDEADEMLDMGFREDIETILKDAPTDRQTVLFSATMPQEILEIAERFQNDPQEVAIRAEQVTIDTISQYYVELPMKTKDKALSLLLHYYRPNRAMVFTNTKSMTDELTQMLQKQGFSADCLHGDMKQQARSRVMQAFKNGKLSILLATDIAARGIDVNDVDYVFNYDLPHASESYVHRIGRTGRAGKTGVAISLCSGRRQTQQIQRIARETNSQLELLEVPTVASIQQKQHESAKEELRAAAQTESSEVIQQMIEQLEAEGISMTKLAAVLASRMYLFSTEGLSDIEYPKKNRSERRRADREEERKRYAEVMFDIGKRAEVRANHIMGAITERTSMTGDQIGKISIFDDYSIVGINPEYLEEAMMELDGCRICGRPVHALLVSVPGKDVKKKDRKKVISKSLSERLGFGNDGKGLAALEAEILEEGSKKKSGRKKKQEFENAEIEVASDELILEDLGYFAGEPKEEKREGTRRKKAEEKREKTEKSSRKHEEHSEREKKLSRKREENPEREGKINRKREERSEKEGKTSRKRGEKFEREDKSSRKADRKTEREFGKRDRGIEKPGSEKKRRFEMEFDLRKEHKARKDRKKAVEKIAEWNWGLKEKAKAKKKH